MISETLEEKSNEKLLLEFDANYENKEGVFFVFRNSLMWKEKKKANANDNLQEISIAMNKILPQSFDGTTTFIGRHKTQNDIQIDVNIGTKISYRFKFAKSEQIDQVKKVINHFCEKREKPLRMRIMEKILRNNPGSERMWLEMVEYV